MFNSSKWLLQRQLTTNRRWLATGVVYISDFPKNTTRQTLIKATHSFGYIFGVWFSDPSSHISKTRQQQQAAIRITTERLPSTLQEISQLDPPTEADITQAQQYLHGLVDHLRKLDISAIPIYKDPDMFQKVAKQELGSGEDTRLFDRRTTSRPRYTRGLIDGYRKGFARARMCKETENLIEQAKNSDDELMFLTEYFEYKLNRSGGGHY